MVKVDSLKLSWTTHWIATPSELVELLDDDLNGLGRGQLGVIDGIGAGGVREHVEHVELG